MLPNKLRQIRKKIDALDQELIRLIKQRQMYAQEVAGIKEKHQIPFTDTGREKEIFEKVSRQVKDPILRHSVHKIYEELMLLSKHTRLAQKKSFTHPISIGIIGYGRFGSLLAKIFQTHWQQAVVKVYSPEHKRNNRSFFSLREVCQCDLLIPCVPMSVFAHLLRKIKPLVRPDTVVIDICSVKSETTKSMRKILSKQQPLISTHPMFGPDSTHQGIHFLGLNMMMYNVSAPGKIYALFQSFWRNLGVRIVEMTPAQHDRYAAYTMNYDHLLGRIGEMVGIKPTPIDTKGFKTLYEALQYVTKDSWQLFLDMQRYNPYAKEMRRKVLQALLKIDRALKNKKTRIPSK